MRMGIESTIIFAAVVLMVAQNLSALPLQGLENGGLERERRGRLLKGLLIGGALYGGTKLTVHEVKKHNPCAFHNSGITDQGEMENKMAADQRCQEYFQKYQSQLNLCPNAVSASCQSIGGDTQCAVTTAAGTFKPVSSCVS
ncbi:unnamed protein product [Bemisia tabaci]|uniref:Secreted protein n=1 Tax=Bemisia tabaci TaxID=7038 RepID=A0A9P0C4Y6_BEMTA|nr:unnamed protein product [Bemisia tabaci]